VKKTSEVQSVNGHSQFWYDMVPTMLSRQYVIMIICCGVLCAAFTQGQSVRSGLQPELPWLDVDGRAIPIDADGQAQVSDMDLGSGRLAVHFGSRDGVLRPLRRFRCKLEGYDGEWRDPACLRQAPRPHPPPGRGSVPGTWQAAVGENNLNSHVGRAPRPTGGSL
jgi:hypothetical protein